MCSGVCNAVCNAVYSGVCSDVCSGACSDTCIGLCSGVVVSSVVMGGSGCRLFQFHWKYYYSHSHFFLSHHESIVHFKFKEGNLGQSSVHLCTNLKHEHLYGFTGLICTRRKSLFGDLLHGKS